MRRKLLRSLDKSLGRAVTLLVAAYDRSLGRLARIGPVRGKASGPRRILIVKLVGIGDTVLMLTALRRLRDAFPDAKVSALVTPLSSQILAHQPLVDDIISYDVLGSQRGIGSLLRVVKLLRSRKFDCVIDFEQYFQMTALLSYSTGAPVRIGFRFGDNPRRLLYTHPVPFQPSRHMVDCFMSLLSPLGFEAAAIDTLEDIHTGTEAEKAVDSWLASLRVSGEEVLIGIHAGSGPRAPYKRWDYRRFAEIIIRVRDSLRASVVLTGTGEESELIDQIRSLTGEEAVYSAAGRFTMLETAALIRRCRLFLSNDTGPMHIAAAVGTPTIGLFGPEHPCRYGPVGSRNTSMYKAVECAPCVHIYEGRADDCGDPVCMNAISAEDVWKVIERYSAGW